MLDGTNGSDTNRRIRVRDRMRFPGPGDLESLLRESKGTGKLMFAWVYDFHNAHRLVPVMEKDWGLQAFRLEDLPDEVYAYVCGTFGIASAAYWWSRVAASVVRVMRYLLGADRAIFHLLYADDGLGMCDASHCVESMLLPFLIFDVLEVPMAWKKVRGGSKVSWIGYTIDTNGFMLGISDKKVEWVLSWVGKHLEEGGIVGRQMKAGLGRFSFIAGVLDHIKPFLGPLFAWSAAISPGSFLELPDAIGVLLSWVAMKVKTKFMRPCRSLRTEGGDIFRIDAKAEGDLIVVAGWETFGGCSTSMARWFSAELNKRNASWAYEKGEPFRTVAALELAAVLTAVMVFKKGALWRSTNGAMSIRAFTDNQGNGHVIDKLMTTKYPLCVSLAELAEQLETLDASLDLRWIPRDQNVEADALTNGCFQGFSPDLRISVNFEALDFILLPRLMEQVAALQEQIRQMKAQSSKAQFVKSNKTPLTQKLRWQEPW